MNEWNYRAIVAISCLVASFVAALVSLGVFIVLQLSIDKGLATLLAAMCFIVLILVIVLVAFLFRPRLFLTPSARVLLYGLGVASSGFSLLIANHLSDAFLTFANHAIRLLNPEFDLPTSTQNNEYLFTLLCVTVLAICVIAWLLDRPVLTQPTHPAAPSSKDSSVGTGNRIRLWTEVLLFPIVFAAFVFIIEHRSELSVASPSSGNSGKPLFTRGERLQLATTSACTVVAAYYLLAAALVWCRRKQSTREEYALYAAAAIATIVLMVILLFPVTDFHRVARTPWSATSAFLQIARGRPPSWPDEDWAHTAIAIVMSAVACLLLRKTFAEWGGLQSIEQYRQHQRREKPQLLLEGIRTWYRLLSGEMLPAEYVAPEHNYVYALSPVVDPLDSWKERARELVRLRTTSYALGEEARWHDLKRCWVGRNVDTNKRVLLFIAHDNDKARFEDQLAYIDILAAQPGPAIGDVIFATLTPILEAPQTKWNQVTIEWTSETELLEKLVDFSDYFHAIKRRVTVDRLPDSELTIEQVYATSKVRLPDKSGTIDVEQYLDQWSAEFSRRQLALLGEYGQGKSTAALMWVYHRIQTWNPIERVPLLIELRGLSPRNLTPEELLGAWGQRYNINPRALLRLLVAGKLVLIFEGFDEMDLVGDADLRLRHFRALWCFAFEKAKVLFTGRPNLFFSTPELERALRISAQMAGNPYCEAVELLPFDTGRIAHALRDYPKDMRQQIVGRAEVNERFRELVSRPSLLHVVATLWNEQKLYEKDPNELNSAYVLSLFVRASYRRQGLKTAESLTYSLGLTLDELAYFMSGIAVYMAANRLENQIAALRLEDAFNVLLEAMPDSVSTHPRSGGEAAEPLRNRIGNDELRRNGVLAAVHTAGLLVHDPASVGKFRFAHKSFMEFLIADVLALRILRPDEEREVAICHATGAMVLMVFRFPVAVQFLSELLATQIQVQLQARGESPTNVQYRLAKDLFHALVAQFWNPFSRMNAFMEIVVSGRAQWNLVRGRSPWKFRYSVTIGISGLVVVVGLSTWIAQIAGPSFSEVNLLISSFGGAFVGLLLQWWLFILRGSTGRDPAIWVPLACWSAVCHHIGIRDDVMHRVVGTQWLPWMRGAKFRVLRPSDILACDYVVRVGDHMQKGQLDVVMDLLDERNRREPGCDRIDSGSLELSELYAYIATGVEGAGTELALGQEGTGTAMDERAGEHGDGHTQLRSSAP